MDKAIELHWSKELNILTGYCLFSMGIKEGFLKLIGRKDVDIFEQLDRLRALLVENHVHKNWHWHRQQILRLDRIIKEIEAREEKLEKGQLSDLAKKIEGLCISFDAEIKKMNQAEAPPKYYQERISVRVNEMLDTLVRALTNEEETKRTFMNRLRDSRALRWGTTAGVAVGGAGGYVLAADVIAKLHEPQAGYVQIHNPNEAASYAERIVAMIENAGVAKAAEFQVPDEQGVIDMMKSPINDRINIIQHNKVQPDNYKENVFGSDKPVMVLFYNAKGLASNGLVAFVEILKKNYPSYSLFIYKLTDKEYASSVELDQVRALVGPKLKRLPAVAFYSCKSGKVNLEGVMSGGFTKPKDVLKYAEMYLKWMPKMVN